MMARRIRPALAAMWWLLPTFAAAQGLSPEERRIAEEADRHAAEAISLLEKVVNIPSATQNLDGVRKVGAIFRAEFEGLGFETRWAAMPVAMHRAGHLIAERKGTRGKRLLLIGHLDTVLEGAPFARDGDRAKGNGALDMKGGDVIVLYALRALASVGALEDRRIVAVFTGDEEDAGMPLERSRGDLREAARRSDLALAFEAAIDDTATVARRGASSWRLEVRGVTGHSAGVFGGRVGGGAIFEAARILDAFRRDLPEKYLTFNPSVIAGGTKVDYDGQDKRGTAEGKTNVVPAEAVVEGDLRFISQDQKRKAEEAMRRIVARNLPRTTSAITFADEYPAMAPTEGNYATLAVLSRASQDLGLGPIRALDPGERGAGDISFVAPLVDGLDGLGAKGAGAHSPNEFVDLKSLPDQIKRASLLIYRLTR
jgi:glutamate carboxypeptidase